ADPASGIIYAQGLANNSWYRFIGATGAWQQLSSAPITAVNDCGAALLDGKIYTAYAHDGALVGVYDIATNRWSAIPGPIPEGTGNIASDGVRFLYFAGGGVLARHEAATSVTTILAAPPFPFERWGGLVHLDGVLYGHQGNGEVGFAKYEIASDRWTTLPSLPDGAVLGATIDPGSREYFTYGSYGGTNLYRY